MAPQTIYLNTISTDIVDVNIGKNELGYDAWGRGKTINDRSLFHGVWTYDVSARLWIERVDNVNVPIETNFTSENGMLKCQGANGELRYLHSRRHPRYQPNRGHLFSTSMILPDASLNVNQEFGLISPHAGVFFRVRSGNIYAVRRTQFNSVITDYEELIEVPSTLDLTKGNVYDIQMQWRGVGNIKFFINLELVHTMNLLGTLNEVSIIQPALPAAFVLDGLATMYSVCVDITTEGGQKEGRQYISTSTSTDSGSIALSGFNDPVLAIRLADDYRGQPNNRDVAMTRVTGYSDQKSILRIWTTVAGIGITGGTWNNIFTDNIQVSEDITSIDTNLCNLIHSRRLDVDTPEEITNPDAMYGDFYLTHGDYIIVTIHRENGGSSLSGATIEMAEEL
jgi:hypothetical protein